MSSKNWDVALDAATRYRRLTALGDVVLAAHERRAIEELIGEYSDGKFCIPPEARVVMGEASYVVLVHGHERFSASFATRKEAEYRRDVLMTRNWYPDPRPEIDIEIRDVE